MDEIDVGSSRMNAIPNMDVRNALKMRNPLKYVRCFEVCAILKVVGEKKHTIIYHDMINATSFEINL